MITLRYVLLYSDPASNAYCVRLASKLSLTHGTQILPFTKQEPRAQKSIKGGRKCFCNDSCHYPHHCWLSVK